MPEHQDSKAHSCGSNCSKKCGEGCKKKGICCACPDTKKARDQCIVERGEEHCGEFIEAHKKCLREAGFDV